MSSDLIGRRRASEQRLDRARSLELALKEKTDILVETTGMSIEQLDFDGSFRAALTALAAVASRRTHFDIIVTLPDAPFAMRIQHVNNAVTAEVLVQRDGPFEPVVDPAGSSSALPAGAYAASSGSFAESSGVYADSSAPYAESPEVYAETVGAAGYAEHPGGYAETPAAAAYAGASTAVAYAGSADAYAETPEAYAESSGAYVQSFAVRAETPGVYTQSSGVHPETPGHHAESTVTSAEVPVAARSNSAAEPTGMVQVASDLADLLWQGVDDMPS